MSSRAANLPPLTEIDWQHVASGRVVLIGAGAVGRPLIRGLAQLGLRQAVVVDPKRYRERSVLSQCRPDEVGRYKAEVVAEELSAMGVQATAMARDVEHVPPGYFAEALAIVSVDNRRADILANRQAGRMRRPLLKVNIEPLFLTASLRFVDFSRSPTDVCQECRMSDAHYAEQHHPLSCDGEDQGRPTASPRPLCELAANAGALVAAQILGSPDYWALVWRNRQWQTNLLGGQTQLSQLAPNPRCRWDHAAAWPNLTPASKSLDALTLAHLLELSGLAADWAEVRFSGLVATRLRCDTCDAQQQAERWLLRLDDDLGRCPCGGTLRAVPFFCFDRLPVADMSTCRHQPLAAWGVEPGSVFAFTDGGQTTSFLIGAR